MMLSSNLSKMLGGSLKSKEAEERFNRESGLSLFRTCSFLGIKNNRSVSVSRF